MSTRATIVVKIKDEDLGKKMKVCPKYITTNEKAIKKYDEKCFEIELENRYAEIYVHHDGYPQGLGISLMEYWNEYDNALNLILSGSASSVTDEADSYVVYDDEEYENLKPRFYKDCPPIKEEYQYLFKEGKWHVRNGDDIPKFITVNGCMRKDKYKVSKN